MLLGPVAFAGCIEERTLGAAKRLKLADIIVTKIPEARRVND